MSDDRLASIGLTSLYCARRIGRVEYSRESNEIRQILQRTDQPDRSSTSDVLWALDTNVHFAHLNIQEGLFYTPSVGGILGAWRGDPSGAVDKVMNALG